MKTNTRGRDVTSQKLSPIMVTHSWEGSRKQSFSMRSERFVSHIRYINSWSLHQKDVFSKCLGLETNRAYVQDTPIRLWRMEILLLRG